MTDSVSNYTCNGSSRDRNGYLAVPAIRSPLCTGYSRDPYSACDKCQAWVFLGTGQRLAFLWRIIWNWTKGWL